MRSVSVLVALNNPDQAALLDRHQIFGAGQNENIGASASRYCGNPFSVLRVIEGNPRRPSESERAVTGRRIIGEPKLRGEA